MPIRDYSCNKQHFIIKKATSQYSLKEVAEAAFMFNSVSKEYVNNF